jgi:hypothetical protein
MSIHIVEFKFLMQTIAKLHQKCTMQPPRLTYPTRSGWCWDLPGAIIFNISTSSGEQLEKNAHTHGAHSYRAGCGYIRTAND